MNSGAQHLIELNHRTLHCLWMLVNSIPEYHQTIFAAFITEKIPGLEKFSRSQLSDHACVKSARCDVGIPLENKLSFSRERVQNVN